MGHALTVFGLFSLASTTPSLAQGVSYQLAPMTKLRLTVVQFMPTTGDYRRWDALSGEVIVSPNGTVLVPALGPIPVGNDGPDELASQIAARLQGKLGLVDRPDATVEVVDYPPIYVVGGVATPGQYSFRPGMTVLQAVALGGGQFRDASQSSSDETIKLQGELQGLAADILRSTARIARLEAELSGAKEITFPASLDPHDTTIADIMKQEQTIFAARQNELGRQTSALDDLSSLFRAELDVLDQKSKSIDEQAAQAQQQLDGVKDLVSKGVSTVSRQTDLERAVSGLRSDRLDNMIASMSARQGLSEALRNRAKLEDDERSEVSVQLQVEQANLQKLTLNQVTTMRVLRQANEFADAKKEADAPKSVVYSIVRQDDGRSTEIAAAESTALLPGDLVKVAVLNNAMPDRGSASGPIASAASP